MGALSIRDLDDDVKQRLRVRAAGHGRSMEAEVRAILVEVVSEPKDSGNLLQTLLDRVGAIGGADLAPPSRRTPVRAADLGS
jgi:plasmid stability protein